MSTMVLARRGGLTSRRMQWWQPVAAVAGGIAVAGLVFLVTPAQGVAEFLATAVLLAATAAATVSYVIEGPRRANDRLLTAFVTGCFLAALVPLALVLYYTAVRGLPYLSLSFFTDTLRGVPPSEPGGGIAQALVGTLEQVGLATLISVPLGILVAIYITEYGTGWVARAIRFFVDVMTGIPSIVAGLFIYSFLVIGLGWGFSGFAAALALVILMLPIVVRSSEEMISLVPSQLREASYALGVPRWRTILSIVLPTASAGITTGVMLAVARVTGETAPLLLTAFDSTLMNKNPFQGQQSALSLVVYSQAGQAYDSAVNRAWAAASVLILLVIILYTAARLITRRNALARR